MNKPAWRRYEALSGVEYEVLNSKGKYYYTVQLLAGVAIGCECKSASFHKACKHGQLAEEEERQFQAERRRAEEATVGSKGTLNDANRGFALTRK